MNALTTHILDTSLGQPAADVAIKLYRLDGELRQLIAERITNHDGRTDTPLLSGETFQVGQYELVFEMGPHFKATHPTLPDPLFLDDIAIRFGIADPQSHYHVPLLVSPYGFSTYRGS